MSLILDALNRADQQRNEGDASLNPLRHQPQVLPRARPLLRWTVLGLLLSLAVAAVAYGQWQRQKTVYSLAADAAAINDSDAVVPLQYDEDRARVATPKKPVRPVAVANSVAAQQPIDPAIGTLYQNPQLAVSARADTGGQATAPTTFPASPTPTPTPSPSPTSNIDDGLAILHGIPLLTDQSSQFQRSVPGIDYQIHVYSDRENSGFVKLNGSIHKTGSQVMPGMRVIAILKDSVVLDYRSTQFRLAAMNSWVNYN